MIPQYVYKTVEFDWLTRGLRCSLFVSIEHRRFNIAIALDIFKTGPWTIITEADFSCSNIDATKFGKAKKFAIFYGTSNVKPFPHFVVIILTVVCVISGVVVVIFLQIMLSESSV